MNSLRKIPQLRLLIIFMLVVAVCAVLEPVLLSGENIQSALTTYIVEIALVTVGQALVMITGGIDLSVAGVLAVVGICVGTLSAAGMPTYVLVLAGLGIGLFCGAFNGLVVTRLGVPPIMVTLATGILFRGIAEGLANGKYFIEYPSDFVQLGQGTWWILPAQVWIAAVVILILGIGMRTTRYGRWIYATGANLRAARLSGVPVHAARISVYVLSGTLSALAAIVMSARLNSAAPDMGVGLELASITAAVLGGVSVFGGTGSLFGVLLGVVTIAALRSGLTLRDVAADIQNIGIAALLLIVLLLDRAPLLTTLRARRSPRPEPPTKEEHELGAIAVADGVADTPPLPDRAAHP